MGLAEIRTIAPAHGTPYVPMFPDSAVLSASWTECEYRCFEADRGRVFGGAWTGEPGALRLSPWPYDEVCVMVSGRVAISDEAGQRREFTASDAFFVPRAFQSVWETLEPSEKVFVAIDGNVAGE